MTALIAVVLPVFAVVGLGYYAVWRGHLAGNTIEGLMKFAQNFAIPCLLFKAIATLDLGQNFHLPLLGTYYFGATCAFLVALFGARVLFSRPWEDCVAIGFAALFSNSVVMGLPITERAYGADALGPNFAIIALNAPICYTLGFVVMELVRARGAGLCNAFTAVARAIGRNALMIAIALGFVVNVTGLPLPGFAWDAVDLMARAGLPVAIFALGGVLSQYRPEGDMPTILFICAVSLVMTPLITWFTGGIAGLSTGEFRSVVITAAMAPGINAYIFASMYGVGKRVVASSVLLGTALNLVTATVVLALLP